MSSLVKKVIAIDHPHCAGDGYYGIRKMPQDQLWHVLRYKGGIDRVTKDEALRLAKQMVNEIED